MPVIDGCLRLVVWVLKFRVVDLPLVVLFGVVLSWLLVVSFCVLGVGVVLDFRCVGTGGLRGFSLRGCVAVCGCGFWV